MRYTTGRNVGHESQGWQVIRMAGQDLVRADKEGPLAEIVTDPRQAIVLELPGEGLSKAKAQAIAMLLNGCEEPY